MRDKNGFAKILMMLFLVFITIASVMLVYLIFVDQNNLEVSSQDVNQNIDNIIEEEQTYKEIGDNDEIITARNLFYVQLDDNAKIMYRALEENQENMKTGDYRIDFGYEFNSVLQNSDGTDSLNHSFQSAWNAYRFDHMEVFYLDVSKIFLFTKTTTKNGVSTHQVSLGAKEGENYLAQGYTSKEDVEEAEAKVEQVVNEIVQSVSGLPTNEEKIKRVHDWLVNYISYDEEVLDEDSYDIYGALIEKESVCEGYARAFKLIMDKLEIPCLLIAGDATNTNGETESHAWNQVFLNNTWYGVDVTWDDPIVLGSGILDEERKYQYYLKGENEFSETHKAIGQLSENSMEFLYPELAKENYFE